MAKKVEEMPENRSVKTWMRCQERDQEVIIVESLIFRETGGRRLEMIQYSTCITTSKISGAVCDSSCDCVL